MVNLNHATALAMLDKADALFTRLGHIVHRHPQRLAAVVAAMLLSVGGGAFALVSLDDNSKDVVVREIIESIPTPAIVVPGSAATAPALTLFRTTTTRSNDTADLLLKRLGVFDTAAANYLRRSIDTQQVLLGRAGRVITAEVGVHNELLKLTARWVSKEDDQNFQRLVVEKDAVGFTSRVESAPLVTTHRLSSGIIASSLFAATDEASIPDNVAVQIAELFAGDIDFRRALRKGDRFNVVYETLQADDEVLRAGRVLSAEFVNAGKTHQAMWFQEPGSKGQYYTLDGNSLRKAFLTSPLQFTRVSSGYGMRVHPISRDKRAHKGIDYAAPIGTPVRTVGDGVVEFAGVQRGYGNLIEIMHRNGKSTVFAHLSKINVRKGQKVEQGEIIGAVGTTGFSTGPHLHFEFRVDGEHQDPLTIANEGGTQPVSAAAKPLFDRASALMRMQLKDAASVMQASAE